MDRLTTIKQTITFDGSASPVKTWLFAIVCIAWIVPGLIGHDPWKTDEALAFGIVYTMLRDGDGLVPVFAGHAYPPLYYWSAALFAKLFAWALPLHDGARLASGFYMAITLAFTAMTARRLIDERAGRICVLLLIGCLGLLLRAHEINPELAGLAGMSIALFGMTRVRSDAWRGGMLIGLGAMLNALALGAASAFIVIASMAWAGVWMREWNNRIFVRGMVIATCIALAAAALWPLLLLSQRNLPNDMWLDAALGWSAAYPTQGFEPFYFLRILIWYALPAWPIAAWVWWKGRRTLRERIETAVPFAGFLAMLVLIICLKPSRDASAMILLLPLCLAAAQGLDRVSRSLASFLDWFGLIFFGWLALMLWTGWTAAQTSLPRGAARWVSRQVPGYEPVFAGWIFALALVLTLIWLFAVLRTRRSNRRAIVNWSAGMTLVWMLTNLLWLPAIDHARSYRSVAAAIRLALPLDTTCIGEIGLGDAQQISLDYFGNLRFSRARSAQKVSCNMLLVQGMKDNAPEIASNWSLLWEGARPGDNVERFWLYRNLSTTH